MGFLKGEHRPRASPPWDRRPQLGSGPQPCPAHRRAAPSADARARSADDVRGPQWSAPPGGSRARARSVSQGPWITLLHGAILVWPVDHTRVGISVVAVVYRTLEKVTMVARR